MIYVNLLPVRARKWKGNLKQFLWAYSISIFLLLSVIAYLWVWQSREIDGLNLRLSQVKEEVARYAKFEAMLKDLKQRKDLIDRKRTVIQDLQRDRDFIVRLLVLLSVEVPAEEIWFNRLTQSGGAITVDGVALSNESIAEFMRNLESSPYVEKGSVNLTHSRQALMNNMKLREFQVSYRFFPFSEVQKRLGGQPS